MNLQDRKSLIRAIVNRKTFKAVDISAFVPETAAVDNDEAAVIIPIDDREENDFGPFISAEMAKAEGEKIAKVREVDYSDLDRALAEV